MMNIQNPASYPQQAYNGYGNVMAQPGMQPSSYPNDFSQNQFQQSFPQTPQRSNQFPQQPGAQIPPHVYQQLQQQQQQHQHQQHQQQLQHQQQQQQAFVRPQSRGNNGMIPGTQRRDSPSAQTPTNQNQNTPPPRTSAPQVLPGGSQIPNNMAMAAQLQQAMSNPSMAQQVQLQNAVQQQANRSVSAQQQQVVNQNPAQQAAASLSPQSATREKARVTVLLDINSHLLQEVISLQSQGKAGPIVQQPNNPNQSSPTSPSSAAPESTNTFSPTDTTSQNKATGQPSKEYQDCMRRLQANLSYLAAIADAKKRPDGKVPPYPAIISPPPHLKEIQDLYKKLALLFPEASQSKTNQAIAFASSQNQQGGQKGAAMGAGANMGLNQTQG